MADGITISWFLANGTTVQSLCDGPARAIDKFQGPLDDIGGQFAPQLQPLQGLRAPGASYAARLNVATDFSFRVICEKSDRVAALKLYTDFLPSLALQANLMLVITQAGAAGSPATRYLNNAVLSPCTPLLRGVTVEFPFTFKGGVWSTS